MPVSPSAPPVSIFPFVNNAIKRLARPWSTWQNRFPTMNTQYDYKATPGIQTARNAKGQERFNFIITGKRRRASSENSRLPNESKPVNPIAC